MNPYIKKIVWWGGGVILFSVIILYILSIFMYPFMHPPNHEHNLSVRSERLLHDISTSLLKSDFKSVPSQSQFDELRNKYFDYIYTPNMKTRYFLKDNRWISAIEGNGDIIILIIESDYCKDKLIIGTLFSVELTKKDSIDAMRSIINSMFIYEKFVNKSKKDNYISKDNPYLIALTDLYLRK